MLVIYVQRKIKQSTTTTIKVTTMRTTKKSEQKKLETMNFESAADSDSHEYSEYSWDEISEIFFMESEFGVDEKKVSLEKYDEMCVLWRYMVHKSNSQYEKNILRSRVFKGGFG